MAASTRRSFVRSCGAGCAALMGILLSGCASAVALRVVPVGDRVRIRLADHQALSRRGGALRIMPDGAAAPLFVLAQNDGSYLALSSVCTHNGCIVNHVAGRFACPCHGSSYDGTGQVTGGPAERPLQRLRTQLLADGVLEIVLGGAS